MTGDTHTMSMHVSRDDLLAEKYGPVIFRTVLQLAKLDDKADIAELTARMNRPAPFTEDERATANMQAEALNRIETETHELFIAPDDDMAPDYWGDRALLRFALVRESVPEHVGGGEHRYWATTEDQAGTILGELLDGGLALTTLLNRLDGALPAPDQGPLLLLASSLDKLTHETDHAFTPDGHVQLSRAKTAARMLLIEDATPKQRLTWAEVSETPEKAGLCVHHDKQFVRSPGTLVGVSGDDALNWVRIIEEQCAAKWGVRLADVEPMGEELARQMRDAATQKNTGTAPDGEPE